MIDFIAEFFVVVENHRISELFVSVIGKFDFEVESFVIKNVFNNKAQILNLGYIDLV